MAAVSLIFHDEQGDEQMRTTYQVPGSGPVLRQDGALVAADQIQVGDKVRICGGAMRAVDAIETT